MTLPHGPFGDRPNPLDTKIEPAEVFQHPAAGEVGKSIDKATYGARRPTPRR